MLEVNNKRRKNVRLVCEYHETEYDKICSKDTEFFRKIIYDNRITAAAHINSGTALGTILGEHKNYEEANESNNKVIKENSDKDKRLEQKNLNAVDTKEKIMNGKSEALRNGDEHIKNCVKEVKTSKRIDAECEKLGIYTPKYREYQVDHVIPLNEIVNNTDGILDLFLDATENGTFEEVVRLANDKEAVAKLFRSLNASKCDRTGINPEDFPSFSEYVEKQGIHKQCAQFRNEKREQLGKLKVEELKKYEHGEVRTLDEMIKTSVMSVLASVALREVCDIFTGIVSDVLFNLAMCEDNEVFSIRNLIRKAKDKFRKLKSRAIDFYHELTKVKVVPDENTIFDGIKDAVKNVFKTIAGFVILKVKGTVGKIKATLCGTLDLTKKILFGNKHEKHKAMVGAVITAAAGSFAFIIQRATSFVMIIKRAIDAFVTTIIKIVLTIVYTMIDLEDAYGEIEGMYATFEI